MARILSLLLLFALQKLKQCDKSQLQLNPALTYNVAQLQLSAF